MGEEAIFFDNDDANVRTVAKCPNITVVQVSSGEEAENPAPADNFYRQYLEAKGKTLKYYEDSGFGYKEHMIILKDWLIKTQNSNKRYAIFDWDRTLTQVEGVYFPSDINAINNNLNLSSGFAMSFGTKIPDDVDLNEDILEYLCGGSERVLRIRRVAEILSKQGVSIIVLTNNNSAIVRKSEFETLAKSLLGESVRVICSSYETNAGGNKRLAIEFDEELGRLCRWRPYINKIPEGNSEKNNNNSINNSSNNNSNNNENNGYLVAAMPPRATEYLIATTPGPKKKGGRRRTIKLRRLKRRLRATRHGRRRSIRNT